MPRPTEPRPTPATRLILWAAMTGSIVLYGIVIFMIVRDPVAGSSGEPSSGLLRFVFPAVAVGVALAGLALSRVSLSRATAPGAVNSMEVAVWALDESVAVIGFVAAILSLDAFTYLPYAFASLVLLVLHRPR